MFTFGLDTLEDIVTDQQAVELSGIYRQIYHMPENITEILPCYNVYIWLDTLEDIETDQQAVEHSGIYHQIYYMPENIEILQ